VETLAPDQANEVRRDILAMSEEITQGISPGRVVAASTTWQVWYGFCHNMGWDPGLSHTDNPIPCLHFFGRRWRDGRLAPKGHPMRARTAEDALRHVDQAFSMLGAVDLRLNRHGRIDYRLSRTFRHWKKQDGPSKRKRPIPCPVLDEITRLARRTDNQQQLAVADLIWIGFFWLLHPSEYLWTTKDQEPFLLQDVIFRHSGLEYQGYSIPFHFLPTVSVAGFHFSQQKNGISGGIIMHGTTSDPYVSPKLALIRRVQHLRQHGAVATTPLFTFFDATGTSRRITDSILTSTLRMGAALLEIDADTTVGARALEGDRRLHQAPRPLAL
jgi:hypothetical protein